MLKIAFFAWKDPEVKEVIGNLEGETLNKMLEFLDKEMIRLIGMKLCKLELTKLSPLGQ